MATALHQPVEGGGPVATSPLSHDEWKEWQLQVKGRWEELHKLWWVQTWLQRLEARWRGDALCYVPDLGQKVFQLLHQIER